MLKLVFLNCVYKCLKFLVVNVRVYTVPQVRNIAIWAERLYHLFGFSTHKIVASIKHSRIKISLQGFLCTYPFAGQFRLCVPVQTDGPAWQRSQFAQRKEGTLGKYCQRHCLLYNKP